MIRLSVLNCSAFSTIENGIIFKNSNNKIGAFGVSDETITYLVIPETVQDKTVEIVSLSNLSNITSVSIPSTVSEIYIENCPNISKYNVDSENETFCSIDGVIYSKDVKKLLFYPVGNKRTEFKVPESVEIIEECSFKNCKNLDNIILPEGLLEINSEAFYGCAFKTIKFPKSLIAINYCAFVFNENLKKIIIPETLTKINSAFGACPSIETVVFLNEKPVKQGILDYIYSHNFDGCEQNISFYVPDHVTEDYDFFIGLYDNVKNYEVLPLSEIDNKICGDVNYDESFNNTDLIMMEKYLVNCCCLKDWKSGDINGDGIINVFDMVAMRRNLIENN